MADNPTIYVECGEGWKGLYQPLLDLCKLYDMQVLQVKEKFGGLRFYVVGERLLDIIDLIQAAEVASFHTCEDCGEHGIDGWQQDGKPKYRVTTSGRWLWSLCQPCRDKRNRPKEDGV